MKKVVLAFGFLFVSYFTNAQDVKFGIKAGLNVTTLIGNNEDLMSKVGFQAGAFAEIKISEKLAIQPELLYSTQGATFKSINVNVGGVDYSVDGKFDFAYLNIPVMLKYYVAKNFSLEAGPQIGFLTSAKLVVEVQGTSTEQDFKSNLESIDFGLNLGAGYDFTKQVSAGFRYNLGLANIAKAQPGDDSKVRNSVVSISLGYKF